MRYVDDVSKLPASPEDNGPRLTFAPFPPPEPYTGPRVTVPACPSCGAAWVRHGWTADRNDEMSTCLGWMRHDGHEHNPNCVSRRYTCANGHATVMFLVQRCAKDGCQWMGKRECPICIPGTFVDEWPHIEESER